MKHVEVKRVFKQSMHKRGQRGGLGGTSKAHSIQQYW